MSSETHEQGEASEHPAAKDSRSLPQYIGLGARGFLMGCSDVVPGVSGGTMAFILGIYEELIQSIRNIARPVFLRPLSQLKFREAMAAINFWFLLSVGTGILVAIFSMARMLEWLLVNQPIVVWSFFFGLVLASVFVVARRAKRWAITTVIALIAGTVGAYFLVGMVPVQTPETWWFLLLSGALAICAMILPGISGAFILLILGKYEYVLSAVNDQNLTVVALVAFGAVIGIVSFAQILGWLFQRFHDLTIALLIGLMLGSLRKIWPWKVDVEWVVGRHGERVPTVQQNVLPEMFTNGSFNTEVAVAAVLALVGLVAVILLERWGTPEIDTQHEH